MQRDSIKIYDLTPFTLLDFPDTPAAILWIAGCNMRCPYCHNPEIVYGKNKMEFSRAVEFLQKRKRVLEGVVISGGEPTIHKDIATICQTIKDMGYKIKLDTNGSLPEVLQELAGRELLDYVAIDFKASKEKFIALSRSDSYDNLLQSIKIVQEHRIPLEIRTTVHTALLQEEDIQNIILALENLGYKGTYWIQNFVKNSATLEALPEQERKLAQNFEASFAIGYRNF